MRKSHSKKIALLVTLVFMLSILVSPVYAASFTKAGGIPMVDDNVAVNLGSVLVEVPAGALDGTSDDVIISLPTSFKFRDAAGAAGVNMTATQWGNNSMGGSYNWYGSTVAAAGTESASSIRVPQFIPGTQNVPNPLYAAAAAPAPLTVSYMTDNEIRISTTTTNLSNNAYFYLNLGSVFVKDGFDGDINIEFSAPNGSGFPAGSVVVGTVGSSQLKVAVVDTDTFNNTGWMMIRINENSQGALKVGDTLKFTLPNGYEWATFTAADVAGTKLASFTNGVGTAGHAALAAGQNFAVRTIWGNATTAPVFSAALNTKGDKLTITTTTATTAATCYEIYAKFIVEDESKADFGDVEVSLAGESSISTSKLTVGTYGDFGATVSVKSVKEIFAGFIEQGIDDIIIKESLEGTLVNDRTVTLELPSVARWQNKFAGGAAAVPANSTTSKSVQLVGQSYTGSDDRIAKYTVNRTATSGAAELKFEDLEILVQAGYVGDIVLKVGGSAGVTDEIVIATVTPPAKAEATSKSVVQIGAANQNAAEFTITETKAGAFEEGILTLRLPMGVHWTSLPKVEVTEGNLRIDQSGVARATVLTSGDYRDLRIPIDSDSSVASTITVTGAKITVDRTVAEGDIKAALIGAAVMDIPAATNPWPNVPAAGSVVVATVGTPAPGNVSSTVSFTAGQTGVYIENGRTMVQVNMLDELGITKAWDANSKTAYFFNGAKVVAFPIGQAKVMVQGVASITLEAPNKIIDGNTYVALRGLEYLGVDLGWDADTKTATATLK